MMNVVARIYLDHQNNQPLRPQVQQAMVAAFERYGNPSGLHAEGRGAAAAKEQARAKVASLIGARSEELTFTSSGTEANHWALRGLTQARAGGRHWVTSAVEHLSILQEARRMEKAGWQVTLVPVDPEGSVDPEEVEGALRPDTVLVSIQWANAEVGTIQPIAQLARAVKARGILFHTDAVAAAGQVPIDLKEVPADALSLAANTFGGPPGIGALFVRKGVRIDPLFVGGAQEEGRRSGTENLIGIVGMGEAAQAALAEMPIGTERLTSLRNHLIRGILNLIPESSLNGHPVQRLPGHASFSFPGIDAEALVLTLDLQGIAVGLGSACTARTMKASHVLKAMGIEESRALGTITCSLGPQTTQEELDQVLRVLPRLVATQQRGLPSTGIEGRLPATTAQSGQAGVDPRWSLPSRPIPDRVGDDIEGEDDTWHL